MRCISIVRSLLLLLLLLLSITFLRGIYKYATEKKYVSRVYNVAAILLLKFVVH